MKRLAQPVVVAALAALLAGAGSGCIVERHYVREDGPPPVAPPPPPPSAAPAADPGYAADEGAVEPGPGVSLNNDYFYDRLSPYGSWRYTPEYGRVWVPANVSADWRPYCDGHWVLTDYGWTYASDVPWAWAGYHYGRWAFAADYGWYWVPGSVWGPAWVAWRYNYGYVAWAPIGPVGWYGWSVGSPAWVVVQSQHFTQPIRTVALPVHGSASIVAATTPHPITQGAPVRGGPVAGPPASQISRAVGQPVRPVAVANVLPRTGLGGAVSRAGGTAGAGMTGSRGTTSGGVRNQPLGRGAGPSGRDVAGTYGSSRPYDRSVAPRASAPSGRWGSAPTRRYGSYGNSPRASGGGSYGAPSARSSGSGRSYGGGGGGHSYGGGGHSSGGGGGSHSSGGSGGHSSGGHSSGHK